jgi:hypothetical protein
MCSRGADIRLVVADVPVPAPPRRDLIFESGGPWRVYHYQGGRLYELRSVACQPAVYRGVSIDAALKEGVLFAPSGPAVPRFIIEHPLDALLFSHRLARDGHTTLHACGVAIGPSAVLLCGHSGAGKSTSARLWSRQQPRSRVLSDDRIVVRQTSAGLRAFGTPWHGDARFALAADKRPIAAFFLRHAPTTEVRPLAMPEAASRLFACSFPPPWDAQGVAAVIECCRHIASRLPCYELAFRPDRTAVDAVLETIA